MNNKKLIAVNLNEFNIDFLNYGAKKFNCKNIPIGFDEDFYKINKQHLSQNVVHFGLMGKFEKRKHTEKIIKLWLDK